MNEENDLDSMWRQYLLNNLIPNFLSTITEDLGLYYYVSGGRATEIYLSNLDLVDEAIPQLSFSLSSSKDWDITIVGDPSDISTFEERMRSYFNMDRETNYPDGIVFSFDKDTHDVRSAVQKTKKFVQTMVGPHMARQCINHLWQTETLEPVFLISISLSHSFIQGENVN